MCSVVAGDYEQGYVVSPDGPVDWLILPLPTKGRGSFPRTSSLLAFAPQTFARSRANVCRADAFVRTCAQTFAPVRASVRTFAQTWRKFSPRSRPGRNLCAHVRAHSARNGSLTAPGRSGAQKSRARNSRCATLAKLFFKNFQKKSKMSKMPKNTFFGLQKILGICHQKTR